jgi:glycosyltransferase involved in cell wall biosynthesis
VVPTPPLVTVLVAVHDGEEYLRLSLESILRQTVRDLELLVVDDGSRDGTSSILEGCRDSRLRVLVNERRLGLAAALNRGLDEARGLFVARMDADDVAFPQWLERSLSLLASASEVGLVGSGVLDIRSDGRPEDIHLHEAGPAAMRWRALFSAPVFHDTVVLERAIVERHGLRYDPSYGESEDYELWTRVLEVTDGDCVEAPLVLHRLHPDQASRRRGELQRSLAHGISMRSIRGLAPELSGRQAELARCVALGAAVPDDEAATAVHAFVRLLRTFERRHGGREGMATVRRSSARSLARLARHAPAAARTRALREASRLDPALPLHVAARRSIRRRQAREAHRHARDLIVRLGGPVPAIEVVAVFPEPTPYRAPLLDRIAALPDVRLTVLYAADTVAKRTWSVAPRHPAVFLRGLRVPGAATILHHDYPVTPGIRKALAGARPDVVVVSGWSTFAAQAAVAWCRAHDIPYVLVVESHDAGPRSGWRRAVKGAVVPTIVRHASGILATGSLARSSMIARGAPPERVRIFANTVDIEAFGEHADLLAPRRAGLRSRLGADEGDVVVLSVARLVPEKRLDVLVEAVSAVGDEHLLLVVAGEGPERARLELLVARCGSRARLVGDVDWARIVELYVSADVFALVSEREPWGVVVNEAAACGLPLVLSDRVGAAHDLLRDGENGVLVPAGDVDATAAALRELAGDPVRRREMGARSRELARDWGYGPSVEGFVAAVREAVAGRR